MSLAFINESIVSIVVVVVVVARKKERKKARVVDHKRSMKLLINKRLLSPEMTRTKQKATLFFEPEE